MKKQTYDSVKINTQDELSLQVSVQEYFSNNGHNEVQRREITSALAMVPFGDSGKTCGEVFKQIVDYVVADAILNSPTKIINF